MVLGRARGRQDNGATVVDGSNQVTMVTLGCFGDGGGTTVEEELRSRVWLRFRERDI